MSSELYPDLDDGGQRGLLVISRGAAILLLFVYITYLIFQLKTHASFFNSQKKCEALPGEFALEEEEEEETPRMSIVAAGLGWGHFYYPSSLFAHEVCSLLIVTIATSLVADYCEYSVAGTICD
jgi:Ca2+:H+ antiporter